jgi:hypothetical protein
MGGGSEPRDFDQPENRIQSTARLMKCGRLEARPEQLEAPLVLSAFQISSNGIGSNVA